MPLLYILKPATIEEAICDFCSNQPVIASLPCETFVSVKSSDYEETSYGHLAACAVCDQLVKEGKWKELLDRSIHTFTTKYEVPGEAIREELGKLHEQFRKHRKAVN